MCFKNTHKVIIFCKLFLILKGPGSVFLIRIQKTLESEQQKSSPPLQIWLLLLWTRKCFLKNKCFRYQVSDRCASALATSLMKDLGIVTEEDVSSIVDRSKIRREKGRVRKEEVEKRLPDVSKLTCIGFDSRNDPKVG